jgi:hypothetical protein
MTKAQKEVKELATKAAEGKKLAQADEEKLYAAANGKRNHEDTADVGRRLLLLSDRARGFFTPSSQAEPAPVSEPAASTG